MVGVYRKNTEWANNENNEDELYHTHYTVVQEIGTRVIEVSSHTFLNGRLIKETCSIANIDHIPNDILNFIFKEGNIDINDGVIVIYMGCESKQAVWMVPSDFNSFLYNRTMKMEGF